MNQLFLIVTMAGERVALPADQVESVVEIEGLSSVPRAAAHVAGLSALRSRVLTVIDCAASLGLGGARARGSVPEAVVVAIDGHPYALLVDGVEDVFESGADVQPVRTALAAGWRRAAAGMIEADGELLLLVDAAALVAGPQAEAA